MGKIIGFPLSEFFKQEWDDLAEYFSAMLNDILTPVSKVDVFTIMGISVQIDAVIGDYIFQADGSEYYLSFALPFSEAGDIFIAANIYQGTKFFAGREFRTFGDFRNTFGIWFESLPIWGEMQNGRD